MSQPKQYWLQHGMSNQMNDDHKLIEGIAFKPKGLDDFVSYKVTWRAPIEGSYQIGSMEVELKAGQSVDVYMSKAQLENATIKLLQDEPTKEKK